MHHGGVAELIVEALGIDAHLLPIAVELAMLPLIIDIVFIFGRGAQRGMAALPRHLGEPALNVDALQRLHPHRILETLRRFPGGERRPGHLLQLEGAALADSALIGVGEAARIDEHRRHPGRPGTTERALGMGGVGQPHRADLAVAPGLLDDPGAAIIAVGAVAEIFDELAFRAIAAAAILIDHHIALPDEEMRHLGAALRCRLGHRQFRAADHIAAIGRAFENNRKSAGQRLSVLGRPVDVGGQMHAVAHPHLDRRFEDHIVADHLGRRRAHREESGDPGPETGERASGYLRRVHDQNLALKPANITRPSVS